MPPRFLSRRQWFIEFLHRWQTLVFSRKWRLYPDAPYLPLQPRGRLRGLWL